jgi:hypothetical protein
LLENWINSIEFSSRFHATCQVTSPTFGTLKEELNSLFTSTVIPNDALKAAISITLTMPSMGTQDPILKIAHKTARNIPMKMAAISPSKPPPGGVSQQPPLHRPQSRHYSPQHRRQSIIVCYCLLYAIRDIGILFNLIESVLERGGAFYRKPRRSQRGSGIESNSQMAAHGDAAISNYQNKDSKQMQLMAYSLPSLWRNYCRFLWQIYVHVAKLL